MTRNRLDSPSAISGTLDQAVRDARRAHGVRFDALRSGLDATMLRLEVLRMAISEIVKSRKEAQKFIDLQLLGGDKPRLWIDLVSYVVMAPTPRQYQLVRERQDSLEVLFETDDHDEIVEAITRYIADRIVVRERHLVGEPGEASNLTIKAANSAQKYSTLALVFAWFCGVFLGVVGLFTFGVWFAGP